ncbi:hypothetical protein QC589_00555 [Halomonas elongata]|uniref:hypothetical protein n=1 Tax=Halomonas elongata TaxID=2746 RepID=UPI00335BACFC
MSEISAGLDAIHPVVISGSTNWWPHILGALATLVGAFGGAWLGGVRGYKASLQAGLSLTRQSKLEECLASLQRLRSLYKSQFGNVIVALRAEDVTAAKRVWGEIDLESFSRDADLVYSLIKLHFKKQSETVEKLAVYAFFVRHIGDRMHRLHERSNGEDIRNCAKDLQQQNAGILRCCTSMHEALEKEASTE